MQQKKQKTFLVIDSSSLISLERAGILDKLQYLPFQIIIPKSVSLEFGQEKIRKLENIRIEALRGKSLTVLEDLIRKGLDRGEAECLILANKLKTGFMICDDRKMIRRKYMNEDKLFTKIDIFGFSFILHSLFKSGYIMDIWKVFEEIIEKNNWKRSEVEASNYTFLKELGY